MKHSLYLYDSESREPLQYVHSFPALAPALEHAVSIMLRVGAPSIRRENGIEVQDMDDCLTNRHIFIKSPNRVWVAVTGASLGPHFKENAPVLLNRFFTDDNMEYVLPDTEIES